MTSKRNQPTIEPAPRDCATAWFAVLERAKLDDDFERAAEAQRQLERLGVTVKFRRQPRGATP